VTEVEWQIASSKKWHTSILASQGSLPCKTYRRDAFYLSETVLDA